MLLKPEESENAGSAHKCGRKTFKDGAFPKLLRPENHAISLPEFVSQTQI